MNFPLAGISASGGTWVLGLMVWVASGKPLNFLCLSTPTMQIFIYLPGVLVEINELFVKHFEDEKHYKNAK